MSQVASVERIIYTYHLNPCSVHLQIIIAYVSIATLSGCSLSFITFIRVEPIDPHSGQYMFTLSVKAGGLERTLCDPVVMKLFTGPHQLDFAAFVFPPKASLPADCLFCLRVWLRTGHADHRLFAENELWIGKNPDFRTIGDAYFAQLTSGAHFMLVYQGLVGKALVKFVVRWNVTDGNLYKITLEYEAGGVGRILLDDCRIRLDEGCDPQTIAFVIYSVPIKSTPPNASHRLRLWIRTPASSQSPSSSATSLPNQSFIYQRLWKSDDFKLGSELNFGALSSKVVMGVQDARGPQVERKPQNTSTSTVARTPQRIAEDGHSGMHSYFDDRSGNAL